jgi:Ca2+/H+ antiporter
MTLLSHASESVAAKTRDAVGGLLNATLGNLTELLIATLSAWLVTNSGRSAWFVGVLVLMVYLIFALTLYLLPPGAR